MVFIIRININLQIFHKNLRRQHYPTNRKGPCYATWVYLKISSKIETQSVCHYQEFLISCTIYWILLGTCLVFSWKTIFSVCDVKFIYIVMFSDRVAFSKKKMWSSYFPKYFLLGYNFFIWGSTFFFTKVSSNFVIGL